MQILKRIFFLVLFFSWLYIPYAEGQSNKGWDPLAKKYPIRELRALIIPAEKWHPYPSVQHSAGFDKIPLDVEKTYIKKGEQLLDAEWPRLPATTFLEYERNGNRSHYEKLSFARRQMLSTLVLAEVFDRKGRFLDQIINGIWAICEESFWGVPAALGGGLPDIEDPVVDLFAAETAQELAWTYYLLKPELDNIDPLVASRIEYETRRRIFEPYLQHIDWGYLGFEWRKKPNEHRRVNNWNPWINSNVLSTALVLAKDPQMRLKLIHKTMDSIDNFVIPYPADGGSDEGPEYWGRAAGSLLDYLEILKSASGGKIDRFDLPVVKKMGRYIAKMYISYPYFVNYGDADAREFPDPALLYRFGKETNDSVLIHFAAFEYEKQKSEQSHDHKPSSDIKTKRPQLSEPGAGPLHFPFGALSRALPALMSLSVLQSVKPKPPLLRDAWLPDIQVMTARSKANSAQGFYLMAKGGTNSASHNHNDVGNYIVYYNGNPVLVDAGAQIYTAKSFSGRRYELWNNQSTYHNLPDINGVGQHNGEKYTAENVLYHVNDERARLTLDIAGAYPDSANVNKWIRTITLNRGRNVEINEKYKLNNFLQPLSENLLTPYKPDLSKEGVIKLRNTATDEHYNIEYDEKKFSPNYEAVPIDDQRMSKNWGNKLYHIILTSQNHDLQGEFTIRIQ